MSGGQRRKVDVLRALLNEPEILFLDELTTGLDPKTRKVMWKFFDELRQKQHMTVFLTTHYMEETKDDDHFNVHFLGCITHFLLQNRELVKDYEVIKGNMDDVFLNLEN